MLDLLLCLATIIAPPLPDGLCVVDLCGTRIRGTVRRRWIGPLALVEIESFEPGASGTLLALDVKARPVTTAEADALERDHARRSAAVSRHLN